MRSSWANIGGEFRHPNATCYTGKQGMLLAREFISYISRQIVRKLSPAWIEVGDPQAAAAFIGEVVEEDLSI